MSRRRGKVHNASDFLYNTNDIILTLIIIAAVALIIFWRVNVIMDYPKTVIKEDNTSMSSQEFEEKVEEDATTADADAEKSGNADKSSDKEDKADNSDSLYADGKLKAEAKVTIPQGSASQAQDALVTAGLFESGTEFEAVCSDNGLNANNIKAGSFTFAKGSTKIDIAKKLVS